MPWGIVTNKATRFTGPLTRAMPLFATRRAPSSAATPRRTAKPHPGAAAGGGAPRWGWRREHCVYVGDDLRDIVAGRAAGMPTVAATYGYLGGNGGRRTAGAPMRSIVSAAASCLRLLKCGAAA